MLQTVLVLLQVNLNNCVKVEDRLYIFKLMKHRTICIKTNIYLYIEIVSVNEGYRRDWEFDLRILSVPFPHRNLKIYTTILPNIRTILAGAI